MESDRRKGTGRSYMETTRQTAFVCPFLRSQGALTVLTNRATEGRADVDTDPKEDGRKYRQYL